MSKPLAKVTGDLNAPRGPDVVLRISVRRKWFGKCVDVLLPRTLNCARCEGGGCDDCGRSGAIRLNARDEEPQSVNVALPPLPDKEGDVCIRIPSLGGESQDEALGRGHLLLALRPAEESGVEVTLSRDEQERLRAEERQELMKRSGWMAVLLILLFFGLLRLSGWI